MAITGLILFGDSILAGTGASQRELACSKLIKSLINVPVSLRGRNWNTSQDGLDRLEDDVLSQKQFSHILILFGNNDSRLIAPSQHMTPLDQFHANMLTMVRKIKDNGQCPMLCNLQLLDESLFSTTFPEANKYRGSMGVGISALHQLYSDETKKIADESGTVFVDIRGPLRKSKENTIALDGMHPNDLGHKIIAASVLAFLSQSGAAENLISDKSLLNNLLSR
jgi:lysophospholipase L1-like esterase